MNLEAVQEAFSSREMDTSPTILKSIELALDRIKSEGLVQWERSTVYNATFRNIITEVYKASPKQ